MTLTNTSDYAGFFKSNIREHNLLLSRYIELANFLLSENSNTVSMERALMGKYCLQKAYELCPYNSSVLNNLINAKKLLQDDIDSEHLKSALLLLNTNSNSNGKLKIGIRYLQKNDYEKAAYYLRQSCEIHSLDIEALSLLSELYISTGNLGEAAEIFAGIESAYSLENPFYSYFWRRYGQVEFLRNNYDKAQWCLEKSMESNSCILSLNNLAEVKLRCSDKDSAIALWTKSLQEDPLQTSLYLKIYDVTNGLNNLKEEKLENYKISILIYTYNKFETFRNTLESLSKTDIGSSKILILENHCTDGTREFLKNVKNLFPDNMIKVISVPTNIGAPAARNWLMTQAENDDTDFLAYLDDDVILQSDWLKRLVGTINKFPKAGVVGGKVLNEGNPKTIQYIYRYLDAVTKDKLQLTSKHPDELNFGQFDLVRKCLSVMGCCHLLRTRVAREVGEFDIRFSPSQVDDIDHDFLTCLKGYEIIYNGYIETVHCQKAGKDAFMSRASLGNALGNDYKLAMKHPTGEMLRLKAYVEEQDRLDIRNKINRLRVSGYLENIPEVPFDVI